jgi:hypothetical protein
MIRVVFLIQRVPFCVIATGLEASLSLAPSWTIRIYEKSDVVKSSFQPLLKRERNDYAVHRTRVESRFNLQG